MNVINTENVIVGAGLSGLYLGQLLRSIGKSCLILEKSPGVGGRIATRRIDDLGFDHGASFLSIPSNFEEVLKTLSLNMRQVEKDFYVTGGMNQLAKTLARDSAILKQTKLKTITRSPRGWRLQSENDLVFDCQKLIITAPLPQALQLLAENQLSPDVKHPLHQIEYTKALVAMLILKDIPPGTKSFMFNESDFLFMHERNLHPRGVVIKLSPQLSELFFDCTDEKIQTEFLNQLQMTKLNDIQLEKIEIKKWRYALAKSSYSSPYIEVWPGLFLIGDGFAHPFHSAEEVIAKL